MAPSVLHGSSEGCAAEGAEGGERVFIILRACCGRISGNYVDGKSGKSRPRTLGTMSCVDGAFETRSCESTFATCTRLKAWEIVLK